MRKVLICILIMIMVVSFAGCTGGNSGNINDPVQPEPTKTGSTETGKENGAEATKAPAPTTEATKVPEPTAAPEPELPEDAGDFSTADKAFYWTGSTEYHNIAVEIFPVDETRAVIQFGLYNASEDSEIVEDYHHVFTFDLVNKATYRNEEIGIDLYLDRDGKMTVTSGDPAYSEIALEYYSAGEPGVPATAAFVEFIRNIPAADIGDFGKNDTNDTVEESDSFGWFYELALYRDQSPYKTYVVTEDLSAICKVEDDSFKLIWGSLESTMERTEGFEFEGSDENGDEYYYYEMPVVHPYIVEGAFFAVGDSGTVAVSAPLDLTESMTVSSADESIVIVDNDKVTAVAAGETVLNVELVYGGSAKQYTIDVTVSETDPDVTDETAEYDDPGYISLVDTVTYEYTMDIFCNDGLYSIEIISTIGPGTYRHWSYIGEEDPSDPNVINLTGSCTVEDHTLDGEYSEEIEYENETATVTRQEDGSYIWHEAYGEGAMSVFK